MTDAFCAGNLRNHSNAWSTIETPLPVIDWINSGVRLHFSKDPEGFVLPNHLLSAKQEAFVHREIHDLLTSSAIEECLGQPHCVSPIGCWMRTKKEQKVSAHNGSKMPKFGQRDPQVSVQKHFNGLRPSAPTRLASHARYQERISPYPLCIRTTANSLVFTGKAIGINGQFFRSDSMVCDEVRPHDSLVTLDIKNEFHHIPVHSGHHKFLGIHWKGHWYQWTVLPFGFNGSPYFFCKTLPPVIQHLCQQGLRLIVYVDAILLMAPPSEIEKHRQLLLDTLTRLGWLINWEKSSLQPAPCKEFIGYIVVTESEDGYPMIKVPTNRIRRLRHDIKRTLGWSTVTIRILACITGQCIAMTKVIIPGKLLLRNAYHLLSRRSSWNSPLVLDSPTKDDLTWWYHTLESWNGRPIKTKPVEAQLVTDASQTGWGGVLNGKQAAGYWDKQIARMPSNYRKLLAILLAIKAFEHDLKGKTVQVLSDNVVAMAYINHLGGPSPSLTALASAVWITAYELEIALSAKHLAGKENVHADHLSRLSTHYEWQLHPRLFKFLDRIWGPHTINWFASFTNTHLPLYNSLYFNPGSGGVDALTQLDWADHNNFLNAPFRLIP